MWEKFLSEVYKHLEKAMNTFIAQFFYFNYSSEKLHECLFPVSLTQWYLGEDCKDECISAVGIDSSIDF